MSARRNKGTEYCLLHGKGVTLTAATRVSRSAESAAMLDPYYALEPKSINLFQRLRIYRRLMHTGCNVRPTAFLEHGMVHYFR